MIPAMAKVEIFGPAIPIRNLILNYYPLLILSFILSLIFTPLARKLAFRYNILDIPDSTVKTHSQPTAYLGGVAVQLSFLISIIVGLLILSTSPYFNAQLKTILTIAVGSTLACTVGLIDDIKDIKPHQKILGQAICSLLLMIGGIKPDLHPFFEILGINFSETANDIIGYIITLIFVIGATNSLNLIDGLDGLCAGVTAIITTGFFLLSLHLATWGADKVYDPVRIIVSISLMGASLGFLIFNKHPARIFLGDAGSISLGFIIASMMLLFATKNPRWWLASIVIFGLPILDTATALIRRIINKRPIFKSDRGHIYDQMIDRGIPLKKTVLINYLLAASFALAGLFIAVFVRARYAIILDLVIFLSSLAVLAMKGFFKMEGLRGAVRNNSQDIKP